jgi:hypothetical protein
VFGTISVDEAGEILQNTGLAPWFLGYTLGQRCANIRRDDKMRVQLFRFDRYQAGQTDFETGGAAVQGNPIEELDDALKIIASGIAGTENVCGTITVAGHSDRQDRADFSCDQRRESEIVASRDRAVSAWEFCKTDITEHLQQMGSPQAEVEWWDTSDRVTWDLVFAATGMLLNGSANETERAQNRRVDILISIFHV